MKMSRYRLVFAIGIFWIISTLIVSINSQVINANPAGLFNKTISYYVGRATWSALLFALSHFIVAGLIGWSLWSLGERCRMPRSYFFFGILLVVSLIWLLVFPLGYFDSGAEKSMVSYMHEAGSRTMFFAMAVEITFLITKMTKSKLLRAVMSLFVIYAVFCAIATLAGFGWFSNCILLFESFYISAFMILLLWCDRADSI